MDKSFWPGRDDGTITTLNRYFIQPKLNITDTLAFCLLQQCKPACDHKGIWNWKLMHGLLQRSSRPPVPARLGVDRRSIFRSSYKPANAPSSITTHSMAPKITEVFQVKVNDKFHSDPSLFTRLRDGAEKGGLKRQSYGIDVTDSANLIWILRKPSQ
jgi:hypothetical protein